MNKIQQFTILTLHLVLTYVLQLQTYQIFKKLPFIMESKFLITFLLTLKIHLMT